MKTKSDLILRLRYLLISCLLGLNVKEEQLLYPRRIMRTRRYDPALVGDASSSSEECSMRFSPTIKPRKEAGTSSNPLSELGTLKEQLTLIETEYSFVCLLTEADVFDELKNIGCKSQIFLKPYECLSEVVKAGGQKLIIIVSQSLSKHFVPLIHDLIQVIYIYIQHKFDSYYANEDDNYVNDKRYPKVRASFIEQTMFISKLNDDIKQLCNIPLREPLLDDISQINTTIDFYIISKNSSSLKSLTDEEKKFVSFQLIIKTILESGSVNPLNSLPTASELCRNFPKESEDKVLEELIDKLYQKYIPEKAIHFYLSDTLVKKKLNICLRSKNIQTICKSWFFIRDLLKQLPGVKKPIIVYRGHYLTCDAVQRLKKNVGNFITFTKFLTMSTSNIRAIRRSEVDRSHTELQSVVYQLEISDGSTNPRFSMIKETYEETIFLFAAGNVFCIESVEQLANQGWCCKLSINSNDESILSRMFQHYETEIGTSLTYLSLGVYLNEIGEEALARQYYEILLAVTTDSDVTSCIQNNLAIICERRKNLKNARDLWNLAAKVQKMDALKIAIPVVEKKSDVIMAQPVPNTSTVINFYNLACVYQQAGSFDKALELCTQALTSSTIESDSADITLVYSAMGSVYFSQKKYGDALKYFEMALDNALIRLLPTDSQIDQYLNNVRLLKNIINEIEPSDM